MSDLPAVLSIVLAPVVGAIVGHAMARFAPRYNVAFLDAFGVQPADKEREETTR